MLCIQNHWYNYWKENETCWRRCGWWVKTGGGSSSSKTTLTVMGFTFAKSFFVHLSLLLLHLPLTCSLWNGCVFTPVQIVHNTLALEQFLVARDCAHRYGEHEQMKSAIERAFQRRSVENRAKPHIHSNRIRRQIEYRVSKTEWMVNEHHCSEWKQKER